MKRMLMVLTAAVLLAVAGASRVAAYDLPALNLGFTSFVDGGPPAGPGIYFTEYLQYYHADHFTDADGDHLKLPTAAGLKDADLDVFVSLNQVLWQSNWKVLLGGKLGMDVIVPLVAFDMEPEDNFAVRDGPGVLGDILVGPYIQWDPIMGKQGPVFMHRFEFQMLLPTGAYDPDYAINPGSGFFSIDPYWAATWFALPRLTASWRVHYLWNDVNNDAFKGTGARYTQAGQAVHANFAADFELLPKRLRVGVNGYFLKQVTDLEANGDDVSDSREQVVGIGPGLVWHISQNDHIFANVYFEMAAENRPEGQRYNLRWVHHF